MRGPRHGNGRPHLQGRTNRDPLRLIVDRGVDEYGARVETYAYRRRCYQCGEADRAKAALVSG